MTGTLSRRLRVRDDGTGIGRETESTFAEFETEDAIILLGDPGMEKTTLFMEAVKEAANADYTKVRDFLIAPLAAAGEHFSLMPSMHTELLQAGKMPVPKLPESCALCRSLNFGCRAERRTGSEHRLRVVVVDISGS